MRGLSKLADSIASQLGPKAPPTWELLRDEIDGLTGSDLDCTQLDLVTDMVTGRLTRKEAA